MDRASLERLQEKKLWILDMDGTVYLGNRLFEETLPFLERIKRSGASYLFFTNNAARSKDTYVRRLSSMGIPAQPEDILTSGETILSFLTRHRKGHKVYLVGTTDLSAAFKKAGIELWEPKPKADPFQKEEREEDEPDVVVVSFDTSLTYEKLDTACRLIRHGAEFLSTHPDFNCPVEGGFIPDSGAICALVTASTGKTPRYFGKPYEDVVRQIEEHTGLSRKDMVVVGDRLYTDIALGTRNGMDAVLVLSGETTREDLEGSSVIPDFVVENVGALLR